jgi:DNA-binding protein HU-beta
MHKGALINHLAKTNRRPKRHYEEAFSEIFTAISEQLAKGKPVQIIGFGTFYTRNHKGGTAKHFKTGKPVMYGEFRQAAFRPGKLLKQTVRKKKGLFSR